MFRFYYTTCMNDDMQIPSADESATSSSAAPKSGQKVTLLDQLREEISREVTRPEIEIPVPERKGVSLQFSPNITADELKAWRRNATNRKTNELDSIKFACYVVGQKLTAFSSMTKSLLTTMATSLHLLLPLF